MSETQKEPTRPMRVNGYFGEKVMSPLMSGGNNTLSNGNEFNTLDVLVEGVDCRYAPGMFQSDDSHINPAYREGRG